MDHMNRSTLSIVLRLALDRDIVRLVLSYLFSVQYFAQEIWLITTVLQKLSRREFNG